MKKGPNLRWSLIQCSGGDEGDRTPDLLTASQALSQLSYAPVRRSTIRELPRRCKDNFGKNFPGARAPESRGAATAESRAHGADAGARPGRQGPDARLSPRGAPRGRAVLPPLSFPAPSGHLEFRRPPLFALGCGPPCAGLLLHRRRSHYWVRSRFRPLGHFKTMPDYGG